MVKFTAEERNGEAEGESSIRSAKRIRYASADDYELEDIAEDSVDDESSNEEAAGDAGVNQAVGNVSATARDSSVSVILMDPEVLDCTICYESLTVPVFQCENGHIACSSCCTKLKNKCPSCSFPIGYNRCRAIEKVIESVKVVCQNARYGCRERISLNCRKEHEYNCIYSPCTCPIDACNFVGSCKQLSRHCEARHSVPVKQFQYDQRLPFVLSKDCQIILLQEETEGALFILNNNSETLGMLIKVKCVSPRLSRVLLYDLIAKQDINTVRLRSSMENHSSTSDLSSCFLLVPHNFFDSQRMLKMELGIELSNFR